VVNVVLRSSVTYVNEHYGDGCGKCCLEKFCVTYMNEHYGDGCGKCCLEKFW
jgi:uncharacterized cysteine cluster protein YcgN (CxxCxxCC family)